MQRELTGTHGHKLRAARVEVGRDRLAAREEIVRGLAVLSVMELAEVMRAGDHLHAAGLDRRVGERDPGGHLQRRLEAEVGRILVPAHVGPVAGVLGPDREMEQEDIRTDHVLDAVEDLIGPDIRLFHLSVWPKNAGEPAYVSWHQDATYFGLEPPVQVTAWVALTEASIEAGCMEVIPGSHKLGQLHHAEHREATSNLLSRGQTITIELDKRRTEFMPLHAGQLSLHHTHLVHNSRPNLSADRRIGLGLSYIPTSVRCTSRSRLTAMLVRGTDRYGHFDDEPRPRVDFGAAERAAHADAVERFRASNAEQTSRFDSAAR